MYAGPHSDLGSRRFFHPPYSYHPLELSICEPGKNNSLVVACLPASERHIDDVQGDGDPDVSISRGYTSRELWVENLE